MEKQEDIFNSILERTKKKIYILCQLKTLFLIIMLMELCHKNKSKQKINKAIKRSKAVVLLPDTTLQTLA